MPTVTVDLPQNAYDIRIEPGLLSSLGSLVREVAPHPKAAIVIDSALQFTLGPIAIRSLQEAGYDVTAAVMTADESHKSLDTYHHLLSTLLDARLERKSPVVALGGGITGDTTGFVAASYLRGVPFIQCPTTLLAMVDASVGGKTGINMPQGKNLVGAFHQPKRVIIDTDTLSSLPAMDLKSGLAECIKHGMIRDPDLFHWTHQYAGKILNLDSATLVELVQRNVAIKAGVVVEDERESGVRAHLNFGHTFAHAIESATGYTTYKHGQAVAIGMVAATKLASNLGLCQASIFDDLLAALRAVDLPTKAHTLPDNDTLLKAMRADKKVASGMVQLVLPTRIGEVVITGNASERDIATAWNGIRANTDAVRHL